MIDLTPFCHRSDGRDELKQPWTRAGRTYATDGRILLSVPARPDIPDHLHSPNVEKAVLRKLRGDASPGVPVVLPEIPPEVTRPCPLCEGQEIENCEGCHGERVEVKDCAVAIGERRFDARLLRLLAALPKLSIFPEGRADEPMYFIFAEGEGAIMPLRPEPVKPAPVPDNAPAVLEGESLKIVREAVRYIVARLGRDRAAYYQFGVGTESFAQITDAAAVLRGVPVQQVRDEVFAAVLQLPPQAEN